MNLTHAACLVQYLKGFNKTERVKKTPSMARRFWIYD
ncbi:hypothetical protein SAMN05444584_1133 [Acinetobacter apis]|uniref:Uncharacterized protein n=1 Tax=Acinetobacter apis TaxID=1229165 RepID=A0A217EFU3_9GAMM|nr:hypothetical protein SAMN05444584_1133 [Acinetobacter apis]